MVEGGSHVRIEPEGGRNDRSHSAYPVSSPATGSEPHRAVLRATGLVKSFRSRNVVKGVSVEVQAGEVVGLLGPNGAGKTTIFDMMVGLTQPDEGTITLDTEPLTELPMYKRARKGIGYLPQESSVFRRLSVQDNILAILEMLDYSRSERAERVESLLKELDLEHIRTSMAYALSGGERRRLEITRALATSPSFMLLDEPFAGIDPIAVADIQQIITRLKEKGIGILITDHNVQETLSITDRAYIINEGLILEAGSPEAIVKSETARAVYLGDRFTLCGAHAASMKLRLDLRLRQKLIMTPQCSRRSSCCSCRDWSCSTVWRNIDGQSAVGGSACRRRRQRGWHDRLKGRGIRRCRLDEQRGAGIGRGHPEERDTPEECRPPAGRILGD